MLKPPGVSAAGALLLIAVPPAFAHTAQIDSRSTLEAWVAAVLLLSALLYARGFYRVSRSAGIQRRGIKRSAAFFALGWIVIAAALVSPLAGATEGVFSAHMIQHELLMVVGAPLMVLGRPLAIWTWALRPAWRSRVTMMFRLKGVASGWAFISTPAAAAVLHALAIWLWHVPVLFESAEVSVALHALQHSAFLFTGLLFWWALLKPGRRGGVGAAVVCLFLTMLHTGALGVLLTFSGDVWYPNSTSAAHDWGLTALEDQQLGGLIMWVPGGLSYVVAALLLAARWFTPGPRRPGSRVHAAPP